MKEMFEDIQHKFLSQIKSKVPVKYSFAEILSDDLCISTDSAYRRIRGETELSFEELRKLCLKYGVSLDAIISGSSDTVHFNYRAVNPESFSFDGYLNSIAENLATMNSFKVKELTFAAKDLPMFYVYSFSRLAAFKVFFWLRDILKSPGFKDKKFSPEEIPEATLALGRKVWKLYVNIPSVEIWGGDLINASLNQIEHYQANGLFKNKDELGMLMDDVLKMIAHLQNQAERGYKFDADNKNRVHATFKLYFNELTISDNMVFFVMDDLQVVHLGHHALNILTTTDPEFCQQTQRILRNTIKSSTLISGVGEKNRNRFFDSMRDKVDHILRKYKVA